MIQTLFVDCEFNSYRGQLISMALVGGGDLEFYGELELPNPIDGWVNDNVVPLLEFENPLTLHQFQRELEDFLARFDAIHIMADWPEDIQHFCHSLITGPGTRIDTPPLTMEVRRDLDAESLVPHHALWDARAMRSKYFEIEGKANV